MNDIDDRLSAMEKDLDEIKKFLQTLVKHIYDDKKTALEGFKLMERAFITVSMELATHVSTELGKLKSELIEIRHIK
jgi:archaellum component FlaC